MIKKSLLFKCGIRNTIFSYQLLFLEIISFSVYVWFSYEASIKIVPLTHLYVIDIIILGLYISFSTVIYFLFDKEAYRNYISVNEALDDETVERLESVLTNEEVENYDHISVPTSFLSRRCTSRADLH